MSWIIATRNLLLLKRHDFTNQQGIFSSTLDTIDVNQEIILAFTTFWRTNCGNSNKTNWYQIIIFGSLQGSTLSLYITRLTWSSIGLYWINFLKNSHVLHFLFIDSQSSFWKFTQIFLRSNSCVGGDSRKVMFLKFWKTLMHANFASSWWALCGNHSCER